MEITVNGQKKDYSGPPFVTALLESLGISRDAVVVELNRRIVPRCQLIAEPMQDGDTIEIIRFVGGG